MLSGDQKKTQELSPTFSVYDLEDMFLGAIIDAVTDGEELHGKNPEWFMQKEAKMVFNLLRKLKETTGFCDYIAVLSELQKDLGSIEAKRLIEKMTKKVPTGYNPKVCAEQLEKYFIQRQVMNMLEMIRTQVVANPHQAADLFLAASEKLENIATITVDFNLEEEFKSTVEKLNDGTAESLVIPTGLGFFDSLTGGLSTQEVTIIGGRPGHGKTSSVVTLARGILDKNPDKRVAIFQLEMSKESIKRKFLSNFASVSSFAMRTNTLNDEDKQRLKDAAENLSHYNDRLFIFDDIYDLTSMNKIAKSVKADVIFVDFITLMDEMQSEDTRRELGRVAIRAKRFAKQHNVAYVFYSQLNRSVEMRDTKRPEQGDIAESDMLTQLASDIILLSYRYKYTRDEKMKFEIMFHFDKARYSEVGDKKAFFYPDYCRISDYPKAISIQKQGEKK